MGPPLHQNFILHYYVHQNKSLINTYAVLQTIYFFSEIFTSFSGKWGLTGTPAISGFYRRQTLHFTAFYARADTAGKNNIQQQLFESLGLPHQYGECSLSIAYKYIRKHKKTFLLLTIILIK